MNRYDLPKLQALYVSHSQYCPPAPSPADQFVNWPADGYRTLQNEKPFLEHMLTKPVCVPATLAEEVFGRQTRHAHLSLKRAAQLLYERCLLHYKHMADVGHRHMQFQVYHSIAKMNPSLDNRRQSNLERNLIQLESDMSFSPLIGQKRT